jgi:hypothetical protein
MIRFLHAHGGTRAPGTPCGYLGRADLQKMFDNVNYMALFTANSSKIVCLFSKVAP